MKHIYYKNDFAVEITLLNTSGEVVAPPDWEWYIEFTDGRRKYICSVDKGNANVVGNTIMCYLDNHKFCCGEIGYKFVQAIPDLNYLDGFQNLITPKSLPIELWEQESDNDINIQSSVVPAYVVYDAYMTAKANGYTGTADDFYDALIHIVDINTAEAERVEAEANRVTAEQQRVENFVAMESALTTATSKANTATTKAEEASKRADNSATAASQASVKATTATKRANDISADLEAKREADYWRGAKGEKGEKGDRGEKGDQGERGLQGVQGVKGDDGVSPTVTTSKTGKVTTIEITDANGVHTATVNDGESVEVVQSTGTSTTAVMSQKAVSDEMANKLNKKVIQGWQVVTTEVKNGALISSMDFTQYSSSGYCNTLFDVHEGEKYHIKGYSVNTVYCGLFYMFSVLQTQRIITEVGAFDTDFVVPSGVTKIGVNAKMTGTGSLLIEKWVSGYQPSDEFYQEIATLKNSVDANTSDINGVKQSVYTFVEPTTFEDGKYINLSRQETSSASFNYAKYQVQGGDKYRIRGWNINANIPLAFVYSTALGSARLIYGGSSTSMCDEAFIPQGYDTLYVNGQISQKAIIHKITEEIIADTISKEEICVMPYTDSVGLSCVIARRIDNTNDGMIMFGHRTSHPNKFFDYMGVSFSPRGEKGINNIRPYSMQYATLTDYIMPIVVAAVNNADGDFPTNTSYFTGGFHAYGNATSGDVTATMRQISQSIRVDGKEVVGTDVFVYGHKCEIDVVNHLQGCNTEKADGTGREILRQNIHIYADKSQVKVKVEFVALEDVNVYQMDGIGQYLPFDSFRLIGSKSKKGVYTKGTLTRPNDDDRAICAIRSFDDAHYLECGINPYYAEGDCKYNNVEYNAQATTANKGYFHLIAGNAVTLAQNEMLSFEGYFDFGFIK